MARINSRNVGQRTRIDMVGTVADFLGITFAPVDGSPALTVSMRADNGRCWTFSLDAAETAKLFERCDHVRTLPKTR